MEWIAAAGGGAFVLVSLVVGVRLLALAARTRELPELAMGLGLLLLGGVGYPLLETIEHSHALSLDLRVALLGTQMGCHVIGTTAFTFFVARVFRRGSPLPLTLTALVLAGIVGLVLLQIQVAGMAAFVREGAGPWRVHAAVSLLPLVWGGLESARWRRMLRRRLALGLADPVVADRFRLWSVGMFAAAGVAALSTGLELAGLSLTGSTVGSLVVAVGGLVSATSLWLAFVPPRSYLRRLAARTA